MPESLRTRLTRWGFNWFPAYRGTGARVEYIADDWLEVRIRLPLNWRTRNVVGTIFGGSIYASVDPMFMIMLMRRLGRDYIVWDKAATVRFRRPGRTTLRATFTLTEDELEAIRRDVADRGKIERTYTIELIDPAGVVCASCDKVISIRAKETR